MRIQKLLPKRETFNAVSLAVIGAAIILLILGVVYYVQQGKQTRAIKEDTAKTNQLILEVKALEEQNKDINEQNKTLNQQNKNYAYCNAVLLAKYTQDQQPIEIEDLNKCVLKSFPRDNSSTQPTAFSSIQGGTQVASGDQLQPSTGTVQTNQPSAPNQPSQPSKPSEPTEPVPSPQPSNQLITVPNLLQINTPCLKLLLVKTCQ